MNSEIKTCVPVLYIPPGASHSEALRGSQGSTPGGFFLPPFVQLLLLYRVCVLHGSGEVREFKSTLNPFHRCEGNVHGTSALGLCVASNSPQVSDVSLEVW